MPIAAVQCPPSFMTATNRHYSMPAKVIEVILYFTDTNKRNRISASV